MKNNNLESAIIIYLLLRSLSQILNFEQKKARIQLTILNKNKQTFLSITLLFSYFLWLI
jgi:hypothetical protein